MAVVAAGLLGSATASILGKGIDAAGATVSTIATTAGTGLFNQGQGQSDGVDYYSDLLFRSEHPATDRGDASARMEGGRILATSLRRGALDPADKAYLAKAIAARTGLAESDAEKRVDSTFTRAKTEAAKAVETAQEAADAARKAGAHSALWMLFVALLTGAFAASYAATWGGRRRDYVEVMPRHANPALAVQ